MSLEEQITIEERKRKLLAAKNKINKELKHNVLVFADDAPNPYFLRRPTGIMQLDIDLGGGFPAGGVSYISGPDNAGKTFLLYKTFAMHQRLYGKRACIAYAPVEGPVDYFFMRKCGYKVAIPMQNLEQHQEHRKARGVPLLSKDEIKELSTGIGELILILGATQEETLNQVLYLTEEKLCHIIAIDSVSAMEPSAEAALAIGEFGQQGAHATNMKRFFGHFYPLVSGVKGINETSLLFTNQVVMNRAKTEAPSYMAKYMKDWKPAGTNAAKHGKLIDVVLQSGAKEKSKSDKTVVGKEMRWEMLKGKAGTHDNITGEFEYLYNEDQWEANIKTVVSTGIRHGAIYERNGKLSLVHPETGVVLTKFENINGFDTFVNILKGDAQLELIVRREVLAAAKIQCSYV